MRITHVDPGSPLYGYIRPGYSLVSINGREVRDTIDYHYQLADDQVDMLFTDRGGKELAFQFDEVSVGELGLTLEDRKVQVCKNNCIFCFVHQQPKGMRRALYVKDEDYRLSFTHGNFVTLSNATRADLDRIVEQRLSPIYVSVHATDDTLRRCMLKNQKLAPIVPQLKYLSENGITIHTQVVLCPGVNDGDQLARTIDDLAALHPHVATLAVVPVGLTRYRDRLPKLRTYTRDEATGIIDYIEKRQREFLRRHGTRFVWPADEFYVAAGRDFPPRISYEEMEQFENGVGMAREFIINFNRRRAHLRVIASKRRVLCLTGHSAYPFLSTEIVPFVRDELNLNVTFRPVTNRFWGETVTVSGLLTGYDLLEAAKAARDEFDVLVLPPNCLNGDDLFLDDLSLTQFNNAIGKPVVVGNYDFSQTVREVVQ